MTIHPSVFLAPGGLLRLAIIGVVTCWVIPVLLSLIPIPGGLSDVLFWIWLGIPVVLLFPCAIYLHRALSVMKDRRSAALWIFVLLSLVPIFGVIVYAFLYQVASKVPASLH